jgi:EAL domain-containing protein (putative c-di-GMP-specific phosphodiesterase class I)
MDALRLPDNTSAFAASPSVGNRFELRTALAEALLGDGARGGRQRHLRHLVPRRRTHRSWPGADVGNADITQPILTDLERDIVGAAGRDELRMVYQPVMSADGTEITSVEALLRWDHPRHGAVPAAVTISVAEVTGEIIEIGQWVLERACRDRARWQRQTPDVAISVNVSALQLTGTGFADSVAVTLASSGIDARSLILEVTETAASGDRVAAVETLMALHALGIRIALDDFGSGHAAFSYLKRFPASILKIDREFVADLPSNSTSRSIVDAIVVLARSMDMTVTAEGVETYAQQRAVSASGCQNSQGYLFARPMHAADIDSFFECGRWAARTNLAPMRASPTARAAMTGLRPASREPASLRRSRRSQP